MYKIPFIIIWIMLTGYFIKKGARGKAEVILTKDTLKIKWLKKPFFSLQRSKKIQFSEIMSWRYRSDREFDMLKIYLRNTEDIRLEKEYPYLKN